MGCWLALALSGCSAPVGDGRPDPVVPQHHHPDTASETTDTSVEDTTAFPPMAVTGRLVVAPMGGSTVDGPDAAAFGSTVVASWVTSTAETTVVNVARSFDEGAHWETPAVVVTPLEPLSSFPRRPRVAVDGDRVALAFEGIVQYGVSKIGLFLSPVAGPLELNPALLLEPHIPYDSMVWPAPRFAPDGSVWLQWVGVKDRDADAQIARELEDWAIEAPNDDDDQPCECCGMDLEFTDAGDAMMSWRGSYVRDIYVARATPPQGFLHVEQATDNGWADLVCPKDGPVLAPVPDGSTYLAWTDASTGVMQAWVSKRPEDGPWGPPVRPFPTDDVQRHPVIVRGPSGRLWLGIEPAYKAVYGVLWSDDGGETWSSPVSLETPGGPLAELELFLLDGGVSAVGLALGDGAVWLVDLEPSG